MLMLLFVKVRLFSLFYKTPVQENRRGFFVVGVKKALEIKFEHAKIYTNTYFWRSL